MSTKMLNAALEGGNYPLALRIATEEHKKKPSSFTAVQKINALAHVDPPKALSELDDIVKQTPSDPNTLRLLLETYDLLDKEAPDVFENATRKYGSGMLILEWNNYSLQTSNYLAFQKSSMLLKKLMGTKVDEKTQAVRFRAVASIVIACKSVGSRLDVGKRKLLSMIGLKLIEESEIEDKSLDAHQMYLKVQLLLIKGDLQLVVDLLDVFLKRERDLELLLLYFDSLRQLESWEKLLEQCKLYLTDVDDWNTWKLAVLAAKKLGTTDNLLTYINEYKVGRNSTLAFIEAQSIEADKLDAVTTYLSRFMRKPCCFQDLKLVTADLPKEAVMACVEAQFEAQYKGNTTNDLLVAVNYMKFKATLVEGIMKTSKFVGECWKYYNETSGLLSQLPEYDFHAGYELIVMLVQCMLLQAERFDSALVLKLILILEWALRDNKFEFHLKLWLIQLYKLVAQPLLAIEHHNDLKIKNLQLDTIGIQTLAGLTSISASAIGLLPLQANEASAISDLVATASKLYTSSIEREVYPAIMQCLDTEVWQKMGSFMDFQNRMRHSLSKYYVAILELQLARFKGNQLEGSKLRAKLDVLKDCYRRSTTDVSQDLNIDTDIKVNDNVDCITLWDCGAHIPIKEISDKLIGISPNKVRVHAMVELVVYEPQSLIWDELVKQLLEVDLDDFTDIEKWSVRTLAALMTGTEIKTMPPAPRDVVNWQFNAYYATLLDFSRKLDVFIRTPRKGVPVKEIKKQRKIIAETVRKTVAKSSDVKRELRIELKTHFEQLLHWSESTSIPKAQVKTLALKFSIDL